MSTERLMQGKTVLITGATDGIGKITALELARMGAKVVIVGRNPQKTKEVAAEIKKGSENDQIDFLVADLSSQSDVRRLAQDFQSRYDRLDVLVNNAGAVFFKRLTSSDGIEMTWALNHFNYFLLTHLLLDQIKASTPARIVNVSSGAHQGQELDLTDLFNDRSFNPMQVYGRTKLANVYFTYELVRRLEGTGVTANALHPGFVASNFGKSNGGIFRPIMGLFHLAAISPEEGAETQIYLASSPEVEGITGKYFDKKKAVSSSQVSYDQKIGQRLWDESWQRIEQVSKQPVHP